MIGEVIAIAGSEVRRNRILLQNQRANDLPLVMGDRIQLQQAILNLLINAIQAISRVVEALREVEVSSQKAAVIYGGPMQERHKESALANAEWTEVLITVRDSGPGLDPEG
jgi:signal transduction histidine kinase